MKNIKKIVVLVVIFCFSKITVAQQDPQYTQYMFNMNLMNPAYVGSYEALSMNFFARSQWVGIDGAPQTLTFGMNSPVGKNVGLGLSIISDKIGPVSEQNLYGDFSYTLQVSDYGKLALGLKAGFTFFNVNLAQLQLVNNPDPAFLNNNVNKVLPNFGFGALYHTDKFYVGLSTPNLLETFHFEKKGGQITRASERIHLFGTAGYVFDISNDLKFKPSTMVKAVQGAPISIDLSGNLLFYDKFELGVSYRLDESFSAIFNIRASKTLRIGYAYDHTITNLGQFNSGSHEIFLLFNFDFDRGNIISPRFF